MGLPWIQLSVDMPDHPKTRALAFELNEPCAGWYAVRLWTSAGRLAPHGKFLGAHSESVVEDMAGWKGQPGILVAALVKVGMLDRLEDGLAIHNWEDHAGAFVEKFRKDAERKRQMRAARRPGPRRSASDGRPMDVRGTSAGRPVDVQREIEIETETEIEKRPQIPLSVSTDRGVEQPTLFSQEPTTDDAAASGDARAVFDHWCDVMQKGGKTSFDAKRRSKVNARLKDGYTAEQLCKAVDGCALTPHNMGQNDRGEKYNDLELICRDAAHVDRFIQNADKPPVAKVGNDITQASKAAFERVGFIHDF